MAAARQKEMKVSITDDATISRTRLEGGATVVRLDAILRVSARLPAFWSQGEQKSLPPSLSLLLNRCLVNRIVKCRYLRRETTNSVGPEQFLGVFNKADEDHYRRSGEAEEEHDLKYPHGNDSNLHKLNCSLFLTNLVP